MKIQSNNQHKMVESDRELMATMAKIIEGEGLCGDIRLTGAQQDRLHQLYMIGYIPVGP